MAVARDRCRYRKWKELHCSSSYRPRARDCLRQLSGGEKCVTVGAVRQNEGKVVERECSNE